DSSATIVRANLILHQLANVDFGTADTTDSVLLQVGVVQASPSVTNIPAAALLVNSPTALGITGVPTLNFRPNIARGHDSARGRVRLVAAGGPGDRAARDRAGVD